jgi:hypothetical protein
LKDTTFKPVTLTFDATGRIDCDLACLECDYNLRGMLLAGTCPECGMAVTISARRDRLADAPAAWLVQLRTGATLLWWGVLLSPLLNLFAVVLAAWGLWRLTANQPGRTEPAKDRRLRLATRYLIATGLLAMGLALVEIVILFDSTGPRILTGDWQRVDLALLAGCAAFFIGLLAAWNHVAALALRGGHMKLLARARRVNFRWIAGVSLIVILAAMYRPIDLFFTVNSSAAAIYRALAVAALPLILLWLWWETLAVARELEQMVMQIGPPPDAALSPTAANRS